ncbi:MAG: hypothetical protein FWD89_03555 [Firmicutes bacterium]|nr:hypothetical protein [Bacillota bacterium]
METVLKSKRLAILEIPSANDDSPKLIFDRAAFEFSEVIAANCIRDTRSYILSGLANSEIMHLWENARHLKSVLIGEMSVKWDDSISYSIVEKHQNKGFAKEALQRLTYDMLSKNKTPSLYIATDNEFSSRCARSSGYVWTGEIFTKGFFKPSAKYIVKQELSDSKTYKKEFAKTFFN